MRGESADEVAARAILFQVFMIMGWPEILQTDNGSQFRSSVITALCQLMDSRLRHIAPYNPRADGKVENSIRSIKNIVLKFIEGTGVDWPLYLDYAQYIFNTNPHAGNASPAFELIFNRAARPIKDHTRGSAPVPITVDDWKAHQQRINAVVMRQVIDNKNVEQERQRKQMEKRRRILLAPYPVGATVMIRNAARSSKMDDRFNGPYIVTKVLASGSYFLKHIDGEPYDLPVPADQLKRVNDALAQHRYNIKAITNHRGQRGDYEYLIEWKGYDEKTWVPQEDITNDAIQAYWKRS